MGISDEITRALLDILDEADGIAEIQRKEFAERIGCVPSQINYVLTSRFTPEHGYLVESRRGTGGYIRIKKVRASRSGTLMHVINAVGPELEWSGAQVIVQSLCHRQIIPAPAAELMLAALSDKCYLEIPQQNRDKIRARVFKHMLLTLI